MCICWSGRVKQILDMHAGILVFDDDEQGLCEMCERETVLTFHHLVPKQIHATVLKRA